MPTTNYVHHLPNKEFGSTTDIYTIKYNVITCGLDFKKYIDGLIKDSPNGVVKYFMSIGKYLVYLEIYGDWETGLMEYNDMTKSIVDTKMVEFSKISSKYCFPPDKGIDHIQLWNEFFKMKESMIANKDAVVLELKT